MPETVDAHDAATIGVTEDELTFEHRYAGPETVPLGDAKRLAELLDHAVVGDTLMVGDTTVTRGAPRSDDPARFTFGDEHDSLDRLTTAIEDLEAAIERAEELPREVESNKCAEKIRSNGDEVAPFGNYDDYGEPLDVVRAAAEALDAGAQSVDVSDKTTIEFKPRSDDSIWYRYGGGRRALFLDDLLDLCDRAEEL